MRIFKYRAISLVDLAVTCLACSAYSIALSSTAIGGFWTGPDFDHPPMSGLNCLLSGWFHFPIGWLANPVMFAAIVLLLTRCRSAAFLSATGAIGLALLWTYDFCRQFPPNLLMAGYHWWILSMQVIVVGSLCSLAFHYRETWRSLRALWRKRQEPAPNVQE